MSLRQFLAIATRHKVFFSIGVRFDENLIHVFSSGGIEQKVRLGSQQKRYQEGRYDHHLCSECS